MVSHPIWQLEEDDGWGRRYGSALKAIADASSSTFYSATNATTIGQVLTSVISNF